MKQIIALVAVFASFAVFAVDIDQCSDSVQMKQNDIFEKANQMSSEDASNIVTLYTLLTGYGKLNCDQYERQLDSVLEYLNISENN